MASQGARRRQVVDVNTARLVTAAIDALASGGYANLSVAAVIERARVSRKTFYEVFANRHDCFEAVFGHITARGLTTIGSACDAEQGWLAATRSGLEALLSLIDEEPALAKVWFVESLAGHPKVLDQRTRAMSRMADAIHLGSSATSASQRPSRLIAEATVGGISQIIHARLVSQSREPLAALTGSFMYLIVLPYMGAARANAELRRAPTRLPRQRESAQGPALEESLRDMKIRLTYRTIRALSAICAHPGASNLEVSMECGIKDQGQISKLLSRLDGLELIENRGGLSRALGVPNAWYITARGADLVGAVTATEALAAPPRASSTRAALER